MGCLLIMWGMGDCKLRKAAYNKVHKGFSPSPDDQFSSNLWRTEPYCCGQTLQEVSLLLKQWRIYCQTELSALRWLVLCLTCTLYSQYIFFLLFQDDNNDTLHWISTTISPIKVNVKSDICFHLSADWLYVHPINIGNIYVYLNIY